MVRNKGGARIRPPAIERNQIVILDHLKQPGVIGMVSTRAFDSIVDEMLCPDMWWTAWQGRIIVTDDG